MGLASRPPRLSNPATRRKWAGMALELPPRDSAGEHPASQTSNSAASFPFPNFSAFFRKSTPPCAKAVSPGVDRNPEPHKPPIVIVACGFRNGRFSSGPNTTLAARWFSRISSASVVPSGGSKDKTVLATSMRSFSVPPTRNTGNRLDIARLRECWENGSGTMGFRRFATETEKQQETASRGVNSPTFCRRILLRQINTHVHTGHDPLEGGIHVADDFHSTESTGEGFQGVLRGRVFEIEALLSGHG